MTSAANILATMMLAKGDDEFLVPLMILVGVVITVVSMASAQAKKQAQRRNAMQRRPQQRFVNPEPTQKTVRAVPTWLPEQPMTIAQSLAPEMDALMRASHLTSQGAEIARGQEAMGEFAPGSIARELAPGMPSMGGARDLTPAVQGRVGVRAATSASRLGLTDRASVRRALVVNEILSRPLALRRR